MQIIKEPERRSFSISGGCEPGEQGDGLDFRERMIQNNSIEGLLKFDINIGDCEKKYEYNVRELESLKFRCSKEKMNTQQLSELLLNLFRTVFRGREFMLLENDFVLDPELIFLDGEGKPQIAYYSGYGKDLRSQLAELTDFLMNNVDYHDENAVLLVYTVFMKCREETFSLEDLISYTREKSGAGAASRTSRPPQVKKISGPEMKRPDVQGAKPISALPKENELKEITPVNMKKETPSPIRMTGEVLRASTFSQRLKAVAAIVIPLVAAAVIAMSGFTLKENGSRDKLKMLAVICAGIGAATLLERKIWEPLQKRVSRLPQNSGDIAPADEATVLLYEKNEKGQELGCSFVSDQYPTINMTHFPFFIGKDTSRMDFCPDAPGISRHHLKVDRIGLEFTILDLNSTNGSFINDEKLAPNVDYKIHRGDKITLGNCDYYMN